MFVIVQTPLEWPALQSHTPRGKQSNLHGFPTSLTIEDALRYLEDETAPFQAIKVTLTSHIEHLASPRLRKLENNSPAIAVHVKLSDRRYVFACDKWLLPQHNIYAIVMTLRQLRALESYGVTDADILMAQFEIGRAKVEEAAASPVQTQSEVEAWRAFLGLGATATLSDANAVYRARARVIGENDVHALASLNDAIDQARQYLKG